MATSDGDKRQINTGNTADVETAEAVLETINTIL